jgi:heme/copper-type cytochrome/quinol oxidase subunit 4
LLAQQGSTGRYLMTITVSLLLTLIALVCGVLMLISGRWSKFPLAAIAIICLALVQSGLIKM